jgi:glucokinase|tara:strand:+ start:3721 stop:4623 length:903 start_codon:yes stop_codon:yes gene_type:complete
MNKALLVDIGGTNMRYAIASKDSDNISDINKLPFDSNDFEINLQQLIKENNIDVLVLSAAGPKINNTISMTNRNFIFNANDIKDKFSLRECFLLNDWEAIAYSYDYVSDSIDFIKEGSQFNKNTLFVGPGTGLGAALSINNEIVLPTEIGNTTNSSLSLQKNFNIENSDYLTLENYISGSAISAVYKIKTNIYMSSEEIYKKFTENDDIAIEVINGFIKSLAQALSDMALTYLPGNGILLAGSLIRTIYPNIDKEYFKELFIASKNDVHKNMLEMISIGVINKQRTPLYGNFHFYKKLDV